MLLNYFFVPVEYIDSCLKYIIIAAFLCERWLATDRLGWNDQFLRICLSLPLRHGRTSSFWISCYSYLRNFYDFFLKSFFTRPHSNHRSFHVRTCTPHSATVERIAKLNTKNHHRTAPLTCILHLISQCLYSLHNLETTDELLIIPSHDEG